MIRSSTIKRIAQAWGFASILLLPNYADITSSVGDARMRVAVPLTKIVLAQLTDMAIVAVAFGVVMMLLRRLKSWPRIRWVLVAALPPLLLAHSLNLFPGIITVTDVLGLAAVWVAFVAIMTVRSPNAYRQLRHVGGALLTGFVCFAAVVTFQLGRTAFWHPGPQAFSSPIPAASATRPRLVWIVFDELAYKPVFESRDPSLSMPNFDRLREESTVYSDVTPIAESTPLVLTGLMSGKIVTDVAYTAGNRLLLKTDRNRHWTLFDARTSLFGQARRDGLTTSIVGWFVPSCPLFAGIATQCYWTNRDAQDRGPTSLDASYAENVWFPLRILAEQAVAPWRARNDEARWNAEGHMRSVEVVTRHALATLAASNADIIYLHIPAPHPIGFWNRHTRRFAVGGSYLDGLDYSDRLLGQMLAVLESQPRWASTALVVQGDHSWRTWLWRPLPGWTAEDERVSDGGKWDPRPLLMIHAAGQRAPVTVSAPTSLMHVHDFIANQIRADAGANARLDASVQTCR